MNFKSKVFFSFVTTEYDETNEADEFIHRDYISAPLIKRSTTFTQHILLALHTDTVKVVLKVLLTIYPI